ncbi:hypothetical protein JL39_24810 [Rhizobium sp. YS-1r]|nr:hypothetical protein JL39_24810 [Rhizobium sp. YS-1r]
MYLSPGKAGRDMLATPGALFGHQKRKAGPQPFRFPRVAGGRPFSADPDDEVLRLTLTARASPASPERLPVYPMRDGEIVGTR